MLKSKSTTRRLHKKAQVSPVFKYIFVLVVGAIIIIFFIKLAVKTEWSGTQLIKAEVLHMLDASMQAFSVSEYSSGVLPSDPWPQMVHMKFGTKANCGKFTVVGQKFFVPIERVLFGPTEMKTTQLKAWTLAWNFPFRITNLFFLMNSRSKYYLIYDSSNEEFVRSLSSTPPRTSAFEMEHFPEGFEVKYKNSESEPKSVLKVSELVKVTYFSEGSGRSCPDKVSSGLKGGCIIYSPECKEELSSDETYTCYGEVEFYDGNEPTGTSTFIGREMMFGAITADTIEAYECQYGLALSELERFINIYKAKALKLKLKRRNCGDSGAKYETIITMFNNMKTDLGNLIESPSYKNAEYLSSDAGSIKEFNEDEIAGDDEDCEMVF